MCVCCVQAQYVFIHDALSELVVCGETEVAAADIRININHLKRHVTGDTTTTRFQKQFQVSLSSSPSLFLLHGSRLRSVV